VRTRVEQGAGDEDAGFATIWAAGVIVVVLAVMLVGVNLGAAASHRHRAEAAADLAALAAASHASDGEAAACAYAARVVEGMASRLVACRLSGWDASVETEVRAALMFGLGGAASGRGRSGPARG
jgi:secretion/DNA translocation related TadE-like protein